MADFCRYYDLCSFGDSCHKAPDDDQIYEVDMKKAPSCFRGRAVRRPKPKNKVRKFREYEAN